MHVINAHTIHTMTCTQALAMDIQLSVPCSGLSLLWKQRVRLARSLLLVVSLTRQLFLGWEA